MVYEMYLIKPDSNYEHGDKEKKSIVHNKNERK